MRCPSCGQENGGKFGDLCPQCEKRQASRHAPAKPESAPLDDGKTPLVRTPPATRRGHRSTA